MEFPTIYQIMVKSVLTCKIVEEFRDTFRGHHSSELKTYMGSLDYNLKKHFFLGYRVIV